LTIPNQC